MLDRAKQFLVKSLLELLHDFSSLGHILTLITNDSLQPNYEHLTQNGLEKIFSDVIFSDSEFPSKPSPTSLKFLIQKHDIPLERSCYIGDSESDMIAARQANIRTFGVLTSITTAGKLREYTNDVFVTATHALNFMRSKH